MTNRRVVVALVCTLSAMGITARAQEAPADATSRTAVEITPYVFLGSSASSGVGAAVRWPLPGGFGVEVETSSRRAEIGALNSSVSLVFDLPALGAVTPYVAAGVGLDQYVTVEVSPGGTPFPQPGTAVSVNAGGGVRVRVDPDWGFRADARWSNGLGEGGPERWRLYNGVTFGSKGH